MHYFTNCRQSTLLGSLLDLCPSLSLSEDRWMSPSAPNRPLDRSSSLFCTLARKDRSSCNSSTNFPGLRGRNNQSRGSCTTSRCWCYPCTLCCTGGILLTFCRTPCCKQRRKHKWGWVNRGGKERERDWREKRKASHSRGKKFLRRKNHTYS